MKNFPILSFLAALVAFATSLIGIEIACTLMCAAGLIAIMNDDYARAPRALNRHIAPVIDLPPANCATSGAAFELAA